MKRTLVSCLSVGLLVLGASLPAQAQKGDSAEGLVERWSDRELLAGLNEKKNVHAAMSYDEYANLLGNLFGISQEEIEKDHKDWNKKSVVKQDEAAGMIEQLLPPQVESDFGDYLASEKPLKRLDALRMIDSSIKAYYYKAGSYTGEDIQGNAWVNAANVSLAQATIEGDLFITEGAAPGNIRLEDVKVSGTLYIDESIQNSVLAVDSHFNRVVVYEAGEKPSHWSLVWSDEFLASEIDKTKWKYDTGNWIVDENGDGVAPGWGNNELEYYTDSSENSYIEDGKLVIQAKKEEEPVKDKFGSYDYTSAKLKTEGLFSKKYGKFEARMKLPEGQGYWPAFWMMPEDEVYGDWPVSGEIDIMEAAGKDTKTIGGAIHYGEEYPNNTYQSGEYHFSENEDYTDYHTYSIEWEPGEIRWYVDGNLYQTLDNWFSKGKNQGDVYTYPAPFDQEFYIILNLAVGGWYGGNPDETTEFPGKMEVDYVRVYELTGRDYKEPVKPVVEEEELPADAKQPLEDGNLIYDQHYNQGITVVDGPEDALHPTLWNFLKLPDFNGEGTMTIDTVDGVPFAKTEVVNQGNALWSLQQIQKLAVLEGHTYKVTFDAKSNTNRNLMTKVSGGAERNYANYSGEKTVQLTDQVQSYEYTFTLNQATDLGARLEFNIGSNGTAPVWIGNVRVEDITSDQEGNQSKPPLADGNLIYNGTFDQGDETRMNYWEMVHLNEAEAVAQVSETERELEIKLENEGVKPGDILIKQGGLQVKKGQEYELTFGARAAEERSIQVELVSGDGQESYGEQEIHLTKEMKSHSLSFQLPADADPEAQLSFKLGGQTGDVYLDDVRLVPESPPVDMHPLKNGDFSNGMEHWGNYVHFDATGSVSVQDEALSVDIAHAGNETWSVLVEQGNLALRKGMTYSLSFDATSTLPRNIELTVENASYQRYFNEVFAVSEEMQHYEFEWNMTADDTTSLKFLMGKFAGQHEIQIDNVSLEVKNKE
mgnify:CR=1 FL=1